jgi:excisionase family DNA binding protein
MSDHSRVIVVLPGLGTLALEVDVYRRALTEGAALVGSLMAAPTAEEPALDAEQLAAALSLPVTWVEQAAREERIPSIQAGRWRRFKRSAVEAALAANGRARARR